MIVDTFQLQPRSFIIFISSNNEDGSCACGAGHSVSLICALLLSYLNKKSLYFQLDLDKHKQISTCRVAL